MIFQPLEFPSGHPYFGSGRGTGPWDAQLRAENRCRLGEGSRKRSMPPLQGVFPISIWLLRVAPSASASYPDLKVIYE